MPMDLRRGLKIGSKVGVNRLERGKRMTPMERVKQQSVRGGKRGKVVERNGKLVGQQRLGQMRRRLELRRV